MKCLFLVLALVTTALVGSSAQAAFMPVAGSTGPVGAAGFENTLNWMVNSDGTNFKYFFQLNAPVAGQTTSFEIDVLTGGLAGWGTISDKVIDVGSATLIAGPTNPNPMSLIVNPGSIGLSGNLGNASRPSLILYFTSNVSPNFNGTGNFVQGSGAVYGLSGLPQPVPVPAAGLLALIGLPFIKLASRRFAR